MAIPPYFRIIHRIHCSNCGQKVPKTLSIRTHCCPKCKVVLDRDENAAINISLNKALNEVGIILSACGGVDINQPVKQETSLFEKLLL
uniref:zinc ribbon domain-containing protein n=1 Tax=Okeania sp. SIO2F4 TaxID=2607790 RepID=UPI0025D81D8A|nr:zinc ribbon domain-containing protein [Okeania sp. SIO2F4]